ncbi:MAG: NAD(P)H-quinone oxidoreductase subunit 2, chloroplastic [Anaerolineales bacterium]|nr:NAD(P)H-quinone oxidoreductase subunit 2, chloroplastic [Anaerolineales bacterium]
MSAPFLWILLPLFISGFLLFLRAERTILILGLATSILLTVLALIVPINEALLIGPFSFKLEGSLSIFGRSLTFAKADGSLLALNYGLATVWFLGAEPLGLTRRLVPAGLATLALLIASTAVQPFLYAALLIEVAILLAVPMLLPLNQPPGRGLKLFLIYQTLAMPFILFAGWILAGVESSPGDAALTTQATAMLAVGFAFLLGTFPLYVWIPALMEEVHTYPASFLLWILPQTTLFFLMNFINRYIFLRVSPDLFELLRAMGLVMIVTAGLWAAFQTNLGRMFGYFIAAETGLLLTALSLGTSTGVQAAFLQLIPRGLTILIWALCLSLLRAQVDTPRFSQIQGAMRIVPFAVSGLVLAGLTVAGFPLLAEFPSRLLIMEELASTSLEQLLALLVGILGLLAGTIRTLAVSVMAPPESPWESRESRVQAVFILSGAIALLLLGLFPQAMHPLVENLSLLYEHIGQ